jgi:hypothetical protein
MDIYRANIKELKKLGKKTITPMELVHFVNRKDMCMIITYMYQYTINKPCSSMPVMDLS